MRLTLKFMMFFFAFAMISCTQDEISEDDALRGTKPKEEKFDCETAFAYCGDKSSTCFIGNGFNRWGWTLGPYSDSSKGKCELYAGAGQCDLEKGTLVGWIDFGNIDGNFTVRYWAKDGYQFNEVHLYVGEKMFPVKPNGRPTVAPGQYPYKADFPEGASYTEFIIEEEFSDDVYVIAHAVVCAE